MNNKYIKQILPEIHKYNHLETTDTAFISNNDLQYEVILHDDYVIEGNIVKIAGLQYGVYYFNEHIFLLDVDLGSNDYIEYKKDINIAHIVFNNGPKKKFLKLYKIYNFEYDENNIGILENTVNTEVDRILVTGNTNIVLQDGATQSPSSPAKLQSTTKINLTAYNADNEEVFNEFSIRLKSSLKSLPSGDGDILVIDNLNSTSVRINKVGRLIITGNEKWEIVEELCDKTNSVYYMPFNLIQIGNNNSTILCNYFPTISCEEMFTTGGLTYAISNSNYPDMNGIFIKVSNKDAKKDLEKFKSFLNSLTMREPIIVEYLLKNYQHKEISLDKYDLRTYHKNTKIVSVNNVKKVSFFAKTFNISYDNLIPTGTAIVMLTENGEETLVYADGGTVYKYNPDEVRLYGAIDNYYGEGNGENTINLPNEDYYEGEIDLSKIGYEYYISNSNPIINRTGYVPIGGIIHWYNRDVIPDGFLLYEGQEISRTEYADLFKVFGVKYGTGDGATTFNLPDQNKNNENISKEEMDTINYFYLVCYKPETVLPIGSCMLWYGTYDLPPAGYIQADGSELKINEFHNLYKVLGNKFGGSETTFILPNQNEYTYDDLEINYDELYNFSWIIKAF